MIKQIVSLLLLLSSGAAYADYLSCLAAVGQDPKYSPLSQKMPLLGTKSQTFKIISNETYASDDERLLISSWAMARDDCFSSHINELSTLPGPVQSLLIQLRSRIEDAGQKLYIGKITYGSFSKELAAASAQYNEGFNRFMVERERNK